MRCSSSVAAVKDTGSWSGEVHGRHLCSWCVQPGLLGILVVPVCGPCSRRCRGKSAPWCSTSMVHLFADKAGSKGTAWTCRQLCSLMCILAATCGRKPLAKGRSLCCCAGPPPASCPAGSACCRVRGPRTFPAAGQLHLVVVQEPALELDRLPAVVSLAVGRHHALEEYRKRARRLEDRFLAVVLQGSGS